MLIFLEYMNHLARNFNIFNDKLLIKFLKQEFESPLVIKLRHEFENWHDKGFEIVNKSSLNISKA